MVVFRVMLGKNLHYINSAPSTTKVSLTKIFFFRFGYSLNKDSGVVTGLDGALQRLIVNGNAIEDLVEVAKDSRGISRYVGSPCDE